MLAWMYLIPLALLVIAKGRAYYLAGAYPDALRGGKRGESSTGYPHRGRCSQRTARGCFSGLRSSVTSRLPVSFTLPIAPVNSAWAHRAFEVNGDFREEIGWPELVETIAKSATRCPLRIARTWEFWPRTMVKPGPLISTDRSTDCRRNQWCEFILATRLWRSAAADSDRAGATSGLPARTVCFVPTCGA